MYIMNVITFFMDMQSVTTSEVYSGRRFGIVLLSLMATTKLVNVGLGYFWDNWPYPASTPSIRQFISLGNYPPLSTQPGHPAVVGAMDTGQRTVMLWHDPIRLSRNVHTIVAKSSPNVADW